MATTFWLTISCEAHQAAHANHVLREVHELFALCEREWSEFLPESPVYKLNHAAPLERVALTASAFKLLELCERIARDTAHAFDVTAKSARENDARAYERHIEWDAGQGLAWRTHRGAHLGFGAIGKGFALDLARERVEAAGFRDFVLNAGGSSLIFSGFSAPGEPWTMGWSWGNDPEGAPLGAEFEHVSGGVIAVGVSGLQEKGAHILTPPRSQTSHSRPLSALVSLPAAADADALSTALFVQGWDCWVEALSNAKTVSCPAAAAVIEQDGIPRWNGVFQKVWGGIRTMSGALALICAPIAAFAQGNTSAVDLSQMDGADAFTPYLYERNGWWILLPLALIFFVLLHSRRLQRRKHKNEEMDIGHRVDSMD